MDRRIPSDPVAVGPQDLLGLARQRRVFEPGLGKAFGDAAIERNVGRRGVRIQVEGLVVDDVDGSSRGQLLNELVRPPASGVKLEAQLGVELQPAPKRLGRGWITETGRDDEGHRPRRPAQRLSERAPRLTQSQVERGALVGPALVRLLDLERRGEGLKDPGPGQRAAGTSRQLAIVRLRVPRDVLAETFLPTPYQADERRDPDEIARHRCFEPLEPVVLDLEWQLGDPRVCTGEPTHACDPTKAKSPGAPGLFRKAVSARGASVHFLPWPLLLAWCLALAAF